MFGKKKKSAQELIRVGDTGKMTVTNGKIRTGHNKIEEKYYIQITDNKTLESFRIYMSEEFYKNFAFMMAKTNQFTQAAQSEGS